MGVLHTTFVKATNPGGRLYSCTSAEERVNGEIGKLGELVDKKNNIYTFEKLAAGDNSKANVIIGFVMQPEMMYDNSTKDKMRLSNNKINPNEPFVFVPLEDGDKVKISGDMIRSGATVNANDHATLDANQTKVGHTSRKPTGVGKRYFKILNIKDCHSKHGRVGGSVKESKKYKLYTLELRTSRA